MEVDEFYDDTSPEIWKKVIGNDLHYHVGWGDGDILYNAIKHLYHFIDEESIIFNTSKTRALRDFHNLGVKNTLIQYMAKPGSILIDLAKSLGVDTIKFQMHEPRFESSKNEKFRINF